MSMTIIKHQSLKLFDHHSLDEMGVSIKEVVTDSRQVKSGDTFLAYAGELNDGRRFIPQAISAGANAILWDPENFNWNPEWTIPALAVNELKAKVGIIASHVYGYPSQKLWLVGITGTNGKTSCSHWYAQAMTALGRKTAVMGTLGQGFCGALGLTENTTPDAAMLQRSLAEFSRQGAQAVVMEVSSHGLVQGRVNGTVFAVAILTNLSRDHLDYHKDMGTYAAAKARLFFWPGLKYAVVNMDDVLGVELSRQLADGDVITMGYGFHCPEERGSGRFKMIHGSNLKADINGVVFDIEFEGEHAQLKTDLLGKFNASNLLAVIAAMVASGIRFPDAVHSVRQVQPIPGRMEKYQEADQPIVIVDYAHTPDALEKVLCTLKELLRTNRDSNQEESQSARLFCVVGCGGDRDRGKRAMIGEIATRLADEVIFTSDNPRTEEPLSIIHDIEAGAVTRKYHVEVDRMLAIYQAIVTAKNGDIVLVAGKGHEKYQEVNGVRVPFDDAATVQQVLRDLTMKARG